jgi:hypothetical protein
MNQIMRSGYSDMLTGLQGMLVMTDGCKGHRQVVLECLARMTGGMKKLPGRVNNLVLDHKLTLL